jgi:hypothetical protein
MRGREFQDFLLQTVEELELNVDANGAFGRSPQEGLRARRAF